jgi:predicted nucleic acid-binding protein
VVNTLPLQYLFRIHRFQLLKDLFEAVLVAEGVRTELEQGRSLGFQVPDLSQVTWVQVLAAAPGPLPPALEYLGQGEAETILIAKQQKAEWVVLDDWEARRVTRKLGIQIIGTIGILAMAKEQGLIAAVKPLIANLTDVGFWLSAKVQRDILELAGEWKEET